MIFQKVDFCFSCFRENHNTGKSNNKDEEQRRRRQRLERLWIGEPSGTDFFESGMRKIYNVFSVRDLPAKEEIVKGDRGQGEKKATPLMVFLLIAEGYNQPFPKVA